MNILKKSRFIVPNILSLSLFFILSGCSDDQLMVAPSQWNSEPLSGELISPLAEIIPAIDGDITKAEWNDSRIYNTVLEWYDLGLLPTGYRSKVLVFVKNDGDNIYIAVMYGDRSWDSEISSGEVSEMDLCSIVLDKNGSGNTDLGDDKKTTAPLWMGVFLDYHGIEDDSEDFEYNGLGRMKYHSLSRQFHAEYRIPFNSGDPDDIALAAGDDIGIYIEFIDKLVLDPIGVRGIAWLFRDFPNGLGNYIGTLHTAAASPSAAPATPNFSGKMAIRDCRDYKKGDIYIYDFASETLTRLTNGNSVPEHDMYKDNPSLSPVLGDGSQWIVFHGSTDQSDIVNYDLYKIKIDGTGFVKLSNSEGEIRGHPAWSPDGNEIAYVSLRSTGGDVHVMDIDGNRLRILTDSDDDNNDPDWSTDGSRIVFKSTFWTGREQLCIMDSTNGDLAGNPRGMNLVRLTSNPNSDHDGVYSQDGQWIYFERYVGPGEWWESFSPATMWSAKDSRWDNDLFEVWMVRSNGTEEQRIDRNDAPTIVQWLPVGGRSSEPDKGIAWISDLSSDYNIILWLPESGSTPVHIIPELTHVMYIDWK